MPPARGPRTEAGRAAQLARRRRTIALVVGVALVGIIGASAALRTADTPPATEPPPTAAGDAANAAAAPVERDPTPLFASFSGIDLRVPIDPADITQLAFHQASSGTNAVHLNSLVPDADMKAAAKIKAVQPAADPAGLPDAVWNGTGLRLWRSNASGPPDTAVDVGANPGTPVYSPVTGTVLQVKPYKLYDQHDDFEIHIQPEGRVGLELVMIHVDDVTISPGDRVTAGVTQIASVRKLSNKIGDMQLTGYTTNGGDHTHLQLNAVE